MLDDMQAKPSRRPGARVRSLLAALAAALCCALLFRITKPGLIPGAGSGDAALKAENTQWPKVKTINDLETLWEVPRDAKGVLFVAHGCKHQGSDFWPPSQRCPHCLGLPEELRVRQAALQHGYAVIAATSYNRESGCWHNTAPERSEDLRRLPSILRFVMDQEGLVGLPLFAFGASSGGSQALRLAGIMPEVKGVISQITPVNPSTLKAKGGRSYPPTLFVHMAQRDPGKAKTVAEALDILREAGTPAQEIKIAPQPVTDAFLQRSPQISKKQAKAIVAALRKGGALDEDGQLLDDPRSKASNWRQLVQPVAAGLTLKSDVSQVAELLNVAYARHEIVSDHMEACLAWLESGGTKSIEDLL